MLEFAHACYRVADASGLEVGQWQGDEVAKQAGTEFDVDAAGGVAEHVGTQAGEQALEHDDDDQADDQHVQRRQALVHQHLVHHHLKEQRRHQRKQLQEQRHREHFTQQLAVLDQAGQKPAEVEGGQFPGQRGAAGDEDEFATPLLGKHRQRFDGGAAAGGSHVLEQHALAVALGQHDHAAVTHQGQCRQRRQREPIDTGAAAFGLEAQALGRQQQVIGGEGFAGGLAQLVQQRGRLGSHVVQTGDQAQSGEGRWSPRVADLGDL